MPSFTAHYAFEKLRSGESFSLNSYQFTDADRDRMDTLIALGAETHRHTGATAAAANVSSAPTLVLDTGGTLPAGVTIRYKVSLIDPNGLESAASPEGSISTPAPVASPGAPSAAAGPSFGGLTPGAYYYAVSGYTGTATQETLVGAPGYVTLVPGQEAALVTFPSLPAGADGFNLYRQSPGESSLFFLQSFPGSPVSWEDTGAVSELCDRRTPNANTTGSSNKVTVTLPVALPATGWTWRIYRTLVASNYSNSLYHHVVETTTEFGTIVVTDWDDVGGPTSAGQPSNLSRIVGSPSKIDLATESTGALPLARVNVFPVVVTFAYVGEQMVAQGSSVWVNEYPIARVLWARACLGRGWSPDVDDLIVDVNMGFFGNPSYDSIYSDIPSLQPRILVGEQIGERFPPDVSWVMGPGDSITVDVDQTGGGAGTDKDLTVNIGILASFLNSNVDLLWF